MLLPLLTLLGCDPKEEAPPSLSLSTEALEFGEVPVNAPAVQTFELTNDGGGEVEILSISLIEGSAAAWSVDRDPANVLGGGDVLTVSVTFSPSALDAYEGRIQVRSDDTENPNLYVTLAGTGAASTADNDGDGFSVSEGDCNDNDANAYPGAPELCNGRDDDCDGNVPVDEADADRDGFGLCEDDCDDGDAAVYPGAPEICDDKDSNCDGINADRSDRDGDGYTVCDEDCDDEEPAAWPGNPEVCDEVDNDCDGDVDFIDVDRDGHSVCGAAGDCDDNDPTAYPVVVDDDAAGVGTGTEEDPFRDLPTALANLDRVCRTVQLAPGEYEVSETWSSGRLTIGGGGLDPSEVVVTAPAGARHFDVSSGAELTLANLTLTGGTPDSGDGGSVRVANATLTLEEVVFEGNATAGDGGAVAGSSSTLSLSACTFDTNVASDDGGALSVVSGAVSDVGSIFVGNSAVRGGALQLDSSDVDLVESQVRGNSATDEGGGLELIGGPTVVIERATFLENTAGGAGGGISAVNVVANGYLRNNLVRDNSSATNGGGVAFSGSAASIVFANNNVLSNSAPGEGAGVAVDVAGADGFYAWSNIIAWSEGASGAYVRAGAGGSFAYNLAYATSSGTDWALDAADAGENEVGDPLFRSYTNNGPPEADNLQLSSSSPARNSGPTDGEGPAGYTSWADPDGTRNDRGGYGGPGAP